MVRWERTLLAELPPGSITNNYASEAMIEDWAEALAYYVYPYNWPGINARPLGVIRKKYVEDQIKAIN